MSGARMNSFQTDELFLHHRSAVRQWNWWLLVMVLSPVSSRWHQAQCKLESLPILCVSSIQSYALCHMISLFTWLRWNQLFCASLIVCKKLSCKGTAGTVLATAWAAHVLCTKFSFSRCGTLSSHCITSGFVFGGFVTVYLEEYKMHCFINRAAYRRVLNGQNVKHNAKQTGTRFCGK